jgi:hypothetical protein
MTQTIKAMGAMGVIANKRTNYREVIMNAVVEMEAMVAVVAVVTVVEMEMRLTLPPRALRRALLLRVPPHL